MENALPLATRRGNAHFILDADQAKTQEPNTKFCSFHANIVLS
ncbi:hypothetical protein HanXRQr2_Chr04g0163261 [Helianthus annuus]|uniref:Uncharacterized protein n=1 Tax=Helianthus annuus TaxID=4232 RepID=A0A9K3NSM7_HELAN|nr:hypothetical protein HanXRQr2_Chr04g0163261 [Helianthus annuus]KAJ0931092.1 hypothetical protein HanPSC8_Chr04g0157341 [Helianthus annuus]